MKKALLITGLICFYTFSMGQVLNQETEPSQKIETSVPKEPAKKAEYSFSTGTSFSLGNNKSSSYYFAPQMTYQVTPKFKLNTSVVFIRSNMMLPNCTTLNLGNKPQLFEQKSNETIVYASGDYQVNNKLTITGSVMKNFNSPLNSKMQENGWRNSFQMMSAGFQYKISNNMTIGAEFKMVQGNNLYNPLYYNMYQFGTPNPGF